MEGEAEKIPGREGKGLDEVVCILRSCSPLLSIWRAVVTSTEDPTATL